MPVTMSAPARASLAKSETLHSQIVLEVGRLKNAGADPEYVAQAEALLDLMWSKIMGLREQYGGSTGSDRGR